MRLDEINHYIEHPIAIKPPGEKDIPIPIFLTKLEQKKLRRRNRIEREKERQERVLLGLEPPPKPKVKISNLVRVLGTEATADPTQIELEVKKQMAERVANHEARNNSRKLTKEEKKDKKKVKFQRDAEVGGINVALFRYVALKLQMLTSQSVGDLSDPRHKYKVDVNARNLTLAGCAILYEGTNLVVVEGGLKAIKKFKKLMLRRIDWNTKAEPKNVEGGGEESTPAETPAPVVPTPETPASPPNKCLLIWEVFTRV
jgi:U4/U6 small nuclear ribonucleoprotein PRP3